MINRAVLFKHVWRGAFVGIMAVFIPLLLMTALFSSNMKSHILMIIAVMPIIAAVQGLFLGGVVLLGLAIWPIKSDDENENI